ncbi:alcohol dehydrogenase, partial [Klebsiella pneumoniae]|nr:alcohol dehydrogenase [Klebsiella pneumoniae]
FERRLPEMVGQALRDSCTPTNPRAPDANALTELYRQAWHGQQTSPGGAPLARAYG